MTNPFRAADAYVIAVVPELDSPVWLATPAWPAGMQPKAQMSWLVSPPAGHQVELELINISQPRCSDGRALVTAQVLGLKEEDLSQEVRRLTANEPFYLHVNNCLSTQGDFSMRAKVTVQRKKSESPFWCHLPLSTINIRHVTRHLTKLTFDSVQCNIAPFTAVFPRGSLHGCVVTQPSSLIIIYAE